MNFIQIVTFHENETLSIFVRPHFCPVCPLLYMRSTFPISRFLSLGPLNSQTFCRSVAAAAGANPKWKILLLPRSLARSSADLLTMQFPASQPTKRPSGRSTCVLPGFKASAASAIVFPSRPSALREDGRFARSLGRPHEFACPSRVERRDGRGSW